MTNELEIRDPKKVGNRTEEESATGEEYTGPQDQTSVQTFISVLKKEIREHDWKEMELISDPLSTLSSLSFEGQIKLLIQEKKIAKDLRELELVMRLIRRTDVESKIRTHQVKFSEMSDQVFINLLLLEVSEIEKWKTKLKEFTKDQHENVRQVIEDEYSVKLDTIYGALNIITTKSRDIKAEDENSCKEFEQLKELGNRKDIEFWDFPEVLKKYDPAKPEIWWIIGNPGCGKNMLCHKTALTFGMGELPKFSYCLPISCANVTWHHSEYNRYRKGDEIDNEFIQDWLRLSMPEGYGWTTYMTKHIVESDGNGLLLVIDSLDDFIDDEDVPFEQTLLYLLLTRKRLTLATILLTSRPEAYIRVSTTKHSDPVFKIDHYYHLVGFSPKGRDSYFHKRLTKRDEDQMKHLLQQNEDMNILSLIPVNASLFAALLKANKKVSARTLTHLYSELVTYLIRRQLSRMGLERMEKRKVLFHLHPIVLDYLCRIRNVANQKMEQ